MPAFTGRASGLPLVARARPFTQGTARPGLPLPSRAERPAERQPVCRDVAYKRLYGCCARPNRIPFGLRVRSLFLVSCSHSSVPPLQGSGTVVRTLTRGFIAFHPILGVVPLAGAVRPYLCAIWLKDNFELHLFIDMLFYNVYCESVSLEMLEGRA